MGRAKAAVEERGGGCPHRRPPASPRTALAAYASIVCHAFSPSNSEKNMPEELIVSTISSVWYTGTPAHQNGHSFAARSGEKCVSRGVTVASGAVGERLVHEAKLDDRETDQPKEAQPIEQVGERRAVFQRRTDA